MAICILTSWNLNIGSVISRLRCQSFLPYLKVSIISEVVSFCLGLSQDVLV